MNTKTFLSLLLVVISLLGIFDAGYISYEKLTGYIPPCHAAFQCETVLQSQWSSIGPIPLSVLGVLFYSVFFLQSIRYFLKDDAVRISGSSVNPELILLIQGVFGALFSLYLIFIMGVVLKAWCFYCLLSAFFCMMLFSTTLLLYVLRAKAKHDQVHI